MLLIETSRFVQKIHGKNTIVHKPHIYKLLKLFAKQWCKSSSSGTGAVDNDWCKIIRGVSLGVSLH